MINKLKIALLALILSLALPALAIRVVFNGGGYGEMVVLNSFMMMPQVLKALAQDSKELSAGEASLIRLAQTPGIFEAVKVDFFSEQNPSNKVRYPRADHISMSSEMLYDSEGKPLEVGKLWSMAFEAWAQMPSLMILKADNGITRANVKQVAERLIKDLSDKVEYLLAKVERTSFHSLTYDKNSSLLVEFEKGTVDATSLMRSAIQCEAGVLGHVWIKALSMAPEAVTGSLLWSCGQRLFQGEFMLPVSSDLTLENAMSVLEFGVHSVQFIAELNVCDQQLDPKK